jgi:hypothetical protein
MFRDSTATTSTGRTVVVNDDPIPAVRAMNTGMDTGTVRTAPAPATTAPVVAQHWAHVSALATLCLMMGTAAMGATLTGVLAPIGFAAGVVTLILGLAGLGSLRRAGVTGHGLIGLGVLLGAGAMVLAYLAINNELPWLHSDVNEVANLHDWLNSHVSWLAQW